MKNSKSFKLSIIEAEITLFMWKTFGFHFKSSNINSKFCVWKIFDTMAFNHRYHQRNIEIRNAIQTVAIATPKNIFKYITYIVV